MDEFEVFRNEAAKKNNGTSDSVTMKNFFETKIYLKQTAASKSDQDMFMSVDEAEGGLEPDHEEEEFIEFIDNDGNPQKMRQDDLMYVQALLGKVDW